MNSNASGRETAWASWDEWKRVGTLLYSFEDAAAQFKGIRMVYAWKSRLRQGALPVSLELTAALVTAYIEQADEEQHRLSMAMAIVRFINGVTDQLQTGIYAQSVQLIADQIGIADWMVDLRHEATHSQLPGVEILSRAVVDALTWLSVNYWEETASKLLEQQQSTEFRTDIDDYFKEVFAAMKLSTDVESNKKRKLMLEKCNAFAQSIKKNTSVGNLHSVVNCISQRLCFGNNVLLLNLPISSVNQSLTNDCYDAVSPVVKLLTPLLDGLKNSFPAFNQSLLKNYINIVKSDTKSLFSNLITLFILVQIKFCSDGVVNFLLEYPTKLGFSLLPNVLSISNAKNNRVVSQTVELFDSVVDCLSTSRSSDVEKHMTAEQIELLKRLAPESFCEEKKYVITANASLWTKITTAELARLPPMGSFMHESDFHYLDLEKAYVPPHVKTHVIQDDLNTPPQTKLLSREALTNRIDQMFLNSTAIEVYDEMSDGSEKTDEYQLDKQIPWDVDFHINGKLKSEVDETDCKQDVMLNAAEIVFF